MRLTSLTSLTSLISSLIYFLHGPDTYRSRKKLRELVDAYKQKSGGILGYTRLDAEEDDLFEKLPPHSAALFREKTLLVIENALAAKKDYAKLLEARCPVWKDDTETIVIFWEREISAKRNKSAEFLKKYAAKTQEFSLSDRATLRRLVLEEAKERGIALERDAVEALASLGLPVRGTQTGDSWTMVRELEKIELTHPHKSTTNRTNDSGRISDIRGAVAQLKPYHLTDAVIEGRRDAPHALYALKKVSAINDILLLGIFVNAVRGMLLLKSAHDSSERARIAQNENMPDFVAKKLATQATRFSLDDLKKIHQRLFAADVLAKTGSLPADSVVLRIVETGLWFDLTLPQ